MKQHARLSDAIDDSPKRKGPDPELLRRFMAEHEPQTPGPPATPCEEWGGFVGTGGYGRVWHEGKGWQAHRLAYTQHVGPIPEGLVIDHLCRNRLCVNPDHLEPVTDAENIRRGKSFQAAFAARTHCLHGHEFTEENTFYNNSVPTPYRQCRTCKSAAQRRYKGKPAFRHLTADERAEILRLHADGLNQYEIADRVGRHQSTVWRALKK